MAITAIHGQLWPSAPSSVVETTGQTLDAAGESVGVVGQLQLEVGASGSKVLSPGGGGSITFRLSTSATFANGSTLVSVGVQNVSATTGLEDGVFDVDAQLVGGTDTLTASTFKNIVMENGTMTLAAGDLIAIVIEMTARGGADSLLIRRLSSNVFLPASSSYGFPYGTADAGALAKSTGPLEAYIIFDDGTVGWIRGTDLPLHALSTISFNSGSASDEYIGTFEPRVPMQVSAIGALVSSVAATDNFSLVLYSDPFGTPVAIETVSIDPDVYSSTMALVKIAPVTLTPGTVYGVAVLPTTVNSITISYYDLGSGHEALKKMLHFGTSLKFAARANGSGAFAEVQTYYVPLFLLDVSGLDNGVSAGGGMLRHPGMNAGLNA